MKCDILMTSFVILSIGYICLCACNRISLSGLSNGLPLHGTNQLLSVFSIRFEFPSDLILKPCSIYEWRAIANVYVDKQKWIDYIGILISITWQYRHRLIFFETGKLSCIQFVYIFQSTWWLQDKTNGTIDKNVFKYLRVSAFMQDTVRTFLSIFKLYLCFYACIRTRIWNDALH